MLLIQLSVEKKLTEVREFMDKLDTAALEKGLLPIARKGLEDKLEYLRTYACRVEESNEIDGLKALCILYNDPYPNCFQFTVRGRGLGQVEDVLTVADLYPKLIIHGGLIWSGPKKLEDFVNSSVMVLTKDDWGTHT